MAISVLFGMLAFLMSSGSWAEGQVVPAVGKIEAEPLRVVVGRSQVINSPVQIRRASLANPDIADTVVLSPTQLYVVAKKVGVTTLTLWDHGGEVLTAFDLVVVPDLARLKEQLHELLPREEIRVSASHEHLVLSGMVSSATNLSRALTVAEAYAPENVINLLEVGGVQQVMLEVRVAEMGRDLARRLGINFSVLTGGPDFGISALARLASPTIEANVVDFTFSDVVNAIINLQTGSLEWTAFIDALKAQGLVKILAEPNLIALSGHEASFLAGGELPIPIPQGLGTVAIEYKPFGVALTFKPTVLSNQKISMEVTPEVSEVDFSRAITTAGFTVPAFTTRRATTVIELADGQSFAIAGLLQDTVRERVTKFPLLGDIPILGALFRSIEFQKNETELVIIVTPHLVKPLDVATQTLPTSQFLEPSDFDFYLMGKLEGRKESEAQDKPLATTAPTMIDSMLDGPFGHLIPGAHP